MDEYEYEYEYEYEPFDDDPRWFGRRCALVGAAWFIAGILCSAGNWRMIVVVWMFPVGLGTFLGDHVSPALRNAWPLGWLLYLTLTIVLLCSHNRNWFYGLYLVLLVLLALNVVGCESLRQASHIR